MILENGSLLDHISCVSQLHHYAHAWPEPSLCNVLMKLSHDVYEHYLHKLLKQFCAKILAWRN